MSTAPPDDRPARRPPSAADGQRLRARDLLGWILEEPDRLGISPSGGSAPDPLRWPGYAELRQRARERSGEDEAVVVATGTVAGSSSEVVVAAWEFGFLGGSMGTVVGERIAAAFELARERRLPVLLLPATGGARMQEGMASLVQMARTTVAARAHAEAGLLQVAWLRDPTTGGVLASHASLADVIWGEPRATIGFAGPRVAAAMTGGPLPEGSHTAEGAAAAGLLDEVVALAELPARLARLLAWTAEDGSADAAGPAAGAGEGDGGGAVETVRKADVDSDGPDAWTEVQRSRAEDRATAGDHLGAIEVATELHGDRAGGVDPTVRAALARVGGRRVVVVAMDRAALDGRPTPTGYRTAWRAIALAGRLGVPLVTLVDTPGAAAGADAEAAGIASHIARTFVAMLDAPVPVVSLVIGEGGSGGALALAVGDRLLIQEHATFSVIAPEGAAAILHRDPERAPEVAALLKPTARDLLRLGIADEVVPEPAGEAVATAWRAIATHLDAVATTPPDELRRRRAQRWRQPLAGDRR